jgi:uncharacterized protein (TIGR03437 family)
MKFFVLLCIASVASAVTPAALWFEPNQGQAHASVQFLSHSVYLGAGRAAIHSNSDTPVVMDLLRSRKSVKAQGLELLPGITSYFFGNVPSNWRSGVPHFAKVRYKDIYPGIDLIYYGNVNGELEYDFVIAPGADPTKIEIAYNQPVHETAEGDLLVAGIRQKRPRVYQGGSEIAARYVIRGKGRVQIALGRYDHSEPLTVDPVILYSTFLGGPAYEVGTGIQVDSKGFMYLSMFERAPSSPTLNPFQQTSPGSYAAFVAKFTPDGQSNVYYAFAGGTGDSNTRALAVDAAGNAYLTGSTTAFDFPVKNAAQPQFGGGFNDAYVLKFSPDGRTILYSTYLGGNNEDEAYGLAINAAGEAYVAGFSFSSDYPVVQAFQPRKGAGADGILTRLSADGKSLLSSTFLGGDYLDFIKGIALDSGGSIYLIGGTSSDDFPLKNPLQAILPAVPGIRVSTFVTKLTPTAGALVYSTFLGGTGAGGGWSIAVDSTGNAAICGISGPGFPTKNAFQSAYGGGPDDIFVARLTPDGSGFVFSTYVGGSDLDFQNANTLALDSQGNIYVTGWTGSSDFPVKQSLQPFVGAIVGYKFDAFLLKLTPSGSLIYSTLLGGHGDDRGLAVTVDANDSVYLAGSTGSDDFPLVKPFQKTNGGAGDIFLMKLAPDVAPTSPFSPTPGALLFTYVLGQSAPTAQTVSIPAGGAFSINVLGANWASVTPGAGSAPSTLRINVSPLGLVPNVYSGVIQIVPPAGPAFEIPVTLNVLAIGPLVAGVSPSTVQLNSPATTFTVAGTGFTPASKVRLQATSSDLPTTFIDANTLQFSLAKDFFTLSGAYSVNVVTPQAAPSNSVIFTVGAPGIVFGAIANAGSYATGAVSPGEIVSLFGSNLGPTTGIGLELTSSGLVSTSLSGVMVLFDGVPAPLVYVRADQISAIVPYEVGGKASTLVSVVFNGQVASPLVVPVAGSVPSLFTADASGKGQGAILNQDSSVNSPSNPAKRGSVVVLFGTGEGLTDPPGINGKIAADELPKPLLPLSVTIDGKDALVLYAGAAPGEVAGVIQVNVVVPDGVSSGAVPVVLKVGLASSRSDVLVSIQ